MERTLIEPDAKESAHISTYLTTAQVWMMAFSAGAIVANLYYIQPLLSDIAIDFHISVATVGAVAMMSQLGTAIAMLVFVPLGDTKERRRLIVRLLLFATACLILMATAKNLWWLVLASMGVGFTGAIVHVIVPYAANLSPPERRGATVGTVLSGLLFGILLARTLSGLTSAWLGWRAIYWIAAALMLIVATLIHSNFPRSEPELKLSWSSLIRTTGGLIRSQPQLRESALLGAIFFCAFSAFWTTLVFFLQVPPYHYGSGVAGLFGLVGAAGAICAPLIGRAADRYGARRNILLALLLTLISFVIMYLWGNHLAALIVGVVLLDVGVQAGHISNQTRIYSLIPGARSRLNMVYMICYFTAGAIGSYVGTALWQRFGWVGVCAFGCVLILAGCAIHTMTADRKLDPVPNIQRGSNPRNQAL
jgi:predicted MFS family arabinose efflux permease